MPPCGAPRRPERGDRRRVPCKAYRRTPCKFGRAGRDRRQIGGVSGVGGPAGRSAQTVVDSEGLADRTDRSVSEFRAHARAERRARTPAWRFCSCAAEVFSRAAVSRGADRRDQRAPADRQGHAVPLLHAPRKSCTSRPSSTGSRGCRTRSTRCWASRAPLENVIEALTSTIIGYFWQRRDFFVLLHRHETKIDPERTGEWQQGREAVVEQVGAAHLADELGRTQVEPRLAVEMLFGMIRSVCLYRDATARIGRSGALVTCMFLNGVRSADTRLAPVASTERKRAAEASGRRDLTRDSRIRVRASPLSLALSGCAARAIRWSPRRAPEGTRRPPREARRSPADHRRAVSRCGRPSGCSSSSARCSATRR